MKLSDFIHAPQPATRPGHNVVILITAAILFLSALAAVFAGWLLLFYVLWGVGSLLVGLAIMQTRLFWRWVERYNQRPSRPKPQTLKEKVLAEATTVLLIIGAVIMLVYSLSNFP